MSLLRGSHRQARHPFRLPSIVGSPRHSERRLGRTLADIHDICHLTESTAPFTSVGQKLVRFLTPMGWLAVCRNTAAPRAAMAKAANLTQPLPPNRGTGPGLGKTHGTPGARRARPIRRGGRADPMSSEAEVRAFVSTSRTRKSPSCPGASTRPGGQTARRSPATRRAAWEQPDLFAAEMRAAFKSLR
jgi:hypothetical protein